MRIDLQNIDDDGKSFHCKDLSEDLKGSFKDLIGDNDFKIDFEIRPLGNTFQVLGQMETRYSDVCSLCAEDIQVPLQARINEILVIEEKRPRNAQVSQSQQNFDPTNPAATYLNEPYLEADEFLHEIMAAAFHNFPSCVDKEACEERQIQLKEKIANQQSLGHPGFEALKGIKLEH